MYNIQDMCMICFVFCLGEVLGMYDETLRKLVALRIPNRTGAIMLPLIQYWCVPGIRITSDAWGGYFGLGALGYRHLTVIHKRYQLQKSVKI